MNGKEFESYTATPMDITHVAWEFLSFRVDGRECYLYDLFEAFSILGEEYEFPVLELDTREFLERNDEKVYPEMKTVKKITVIEDRHTVRMAEKETSFETAHALLFDFGGQELIFEQKSMSSETMRIEKGFGPEGDLTIPEEMGKCFGTETGISTERIFTMIELT